MEHPPPSRSSMVFVGILSTIVSTGCSPTPGFVPGELAGPRNAWALSAGGGVQVAEGEFSMARTSFLAGTERGEIQPMVGLSTGVRNHGTNRLVGFFDVLLGFGGPSFNLSAGPGVVFVHGFRSLRPELSTTFSFTIPNPVALVFDVTAFYVFRSAEQGTKYCTNRWGCPGFSIGFDFFGSGSTLGALRSVAAHP